VSPSKVRRIHFIGIGGTGMSGLAEVLLRMGYSVSGSDLHRSEVTDRLGSLGAEVHYGHVAGNVKRADLVVVSSAIGRGNPEVRAARRAGTPTLKRGEMLAEIMRLHQGIAVAGSHGKTTTTSLIGHLMARAGLDPTVVVGGRLKMIGGNARMGRGQYLVAEADESDGSFLDLNPVIAVVTNIDREHLDYYRDLPEIQKTFLKFMRRIPFYGLAVVCGDDPNIRALVRRVRKRVLTYGYGPENHLRAVDLSGSGLDQEFTVEWQGVRLGRAKIGLPGRHNALNALAAFAVGLELGVGASECLGALEDFEGVGRRFEIRGQRGGVLLIDDYGHHPTEMAAVLATARAVYDRRLVVLFQPHRYSRTASLAREFAEVLKDADLLILADIYAAGERPPAGVTSDLIVDALRVLTGREPVRIRGGSDAAPVVAPLLHAGDLLITLGAGDVSQWGERILEAFAELRGEGPDVHEAGETLAVPEVNDARDPHEAHDPHDALTTPGMPEVRRA
jgi:UDP-N-acetylmuramate--alanine ligase